MLSIYTGVLDIENSFNNNNNNNNNNKNKMNQKQQESFSGLAAKCKRGVCFLKDDYQILLREGNSFLDLVDVNKLVFTKATKLTPLLDTNIFTEIEKNWIRENRRRAINRKTADESRRRKKCEQKKLIRDLSCLTNYRDQLSRERIEVLEEIESLRICIQNLSFSFHPYSGQF